MLKPAILSISMATVMAGAAISPALGLIAQAFPEASPTVIKLILTAPSLMIIPFSFLSSYLTKKLTKKAICLVGLVIYVIGGVGPQFVSSLIALIGLRLLLGAGVGLVMPLSMTLINDYFSGQERTKMMGYNSAFSNVGGILTMLFAGWLATFGWRVPFNVYFLGLVIFVMIFFFLPKGEVQKAEEKSERSKLPLAVIGYAAAMGGVMLAYYAIATNIALYLEQNELGNAALAGTIVSFTTVGGMITSLLLVQIEVALKNYIIPVMLAVMALAFAILTFSYSIPLIMLAVCFVGFGQGVLFPTLSLKALDQVPFTKADQAIAWTSSATFLGQFLSPVVLDGVSKLFQQEAIRFQYGTLAIVMTSFVMGSLIFIIKKKQKLHTTTL